MKTPPAPMALVVGLGPAGAAAACAAASAGLRVLAIERKPMPGLPVQCAEFVPDPVFDDAPQARGARVQAIGRMVTRVANEAPDLTPGFRGTMIDRARFDQALIAQAQAAGAVCEFGQSLRRIDRTGVTLSDGRVFSPQVIIGADGPLSPVGRAIGCPNTALVDTRQITVDLTEPHDATDIFLRADYPGGYGWLFPKGARANLGIGVNRANRLGLKSRLAALQAELIAQGRIGPVVHATTGGLIPVGGIVGLRGRLGEMVVLLAGDAAGLTHPVTGAGIASAVASGRLAGAAAAALLDGQHDADADYDDEIRSVYETALRHAVHRRRELAQTEPNPQALRAGWIAYPQYWTKSQASQTPAPGQSLTLEAAP